MCSRGQIPPYAVNGFFENGGKRVFICRLVGPAATSAQAAFGDFLIRAAGPGSWGKRIWAKIEDSRTKEANGRVSAFDCALPMDWNAEPFDPFTPENRLKIPQPVLVEEFDDLVLEENSPDYFGKRVNFIDLDKGNTNQGPESRPSEYWFAIPAWRRPRGRRTVARHWRMAAPMTPMRLARTISGDPAAPAWKRRASPRSNSIHTAKWRWSTRRSVDDIVTKIVTHCENLRSGSPSSMVERPEQCLRA